MSEGRNKRGEGMTDEKPFRLEEATIDDLHAAIRAGQITCVEIVRRYIERARAYNGVCSVLVTRDGAPVPDVPGAVRAGAPLSFPTETVPVSAVLHDAQNEPMVYIQVQPDKFAQRLVTVGVQQGNEMEITNGLKAGDNVVSQGSLFVQFALSAK